MKKYFTWKKITLIIILSIIATLIPFIINKSYQMEPIIYITKWGAADVLSFYGNLLGAVATIAAVYLTIDYNSYKEKQSYKRTICPVLSTAYFPQYDYLSFAQEGEEVYFVEIDDQNSISVSKVVPHVITKINDSHKNLTNNIGHESATKIIEEELAFNLKYYTLEYSLKNVGGGSAILINMSINNLPFMVPFAINTQTKKIYKFLINVEHLKPDNTWPINITYEFWDQNKLGKYKQVEKINIIRDKHGLLTSSQNIKDFISPPEEIEDIPAKKS